MSEHPWRERPVLVTGATGFVGRALVRRLSREGARVRALVRTPAKAERVEGLEGVVPVQGDLVDEVAMAEAVRDVRVVVNSAAALRGTEAEQERINITGTRILAEAAAGAGVDRFVHISSVAVYGFQPGVRLDESSKAPPGTYTYGRTKAGAERSVREVAARTGLSVSIVRPGTIYGPEARTWSGRLFGWSQRRPLWLPAGGRGTVPYIYVDDVVDLCLVCADHPEAAGETFNAVMDPPPTLREVLGAWARLTGEPRFLTLPTGLLRPIAWLLARRGDPDSPRRQAPTVLRMLGEPTRWPMDKARDRLGWSPRVALEEGVRGCVPWLLEKGLLP